MPAKEWTVVPPMLRPAIPVEAVTANEDGSGDKEPGLDGFNGESGFSTLIISLRRTDLPVPA